MCLSAQTFLIVSQLFWPGCSRMQCEHVPRELSNLLITKPHDERKQSRDQTEPVIIKFITLIKVIALSMPLLVHHLRFNIYTYNMSWGPSVLTRSNALYWCKCWYTTSSYLIHTHTSCPSEETCLMSNIPIRHFNCHMTWKRNKGLNGLHDKHIRWCITGF